MKQEIKLSKLQSQGIFADSKQDKDSMVSRKSYNLSDIKVEDGEERTFTAICATNDCDREGEVVLPQGLNVTEYSKNPVLVFAHDYSKYTIGKCTSLKIDDKMTCKFWMANTTAGNEAWELVKSGCLSSVSIGFIRENVLKRGTPAFNEAIKRYGISQMENIKQITSKAELVEVSLVPIPANRNAIIQEIAAKGLGCMAGAMGCNIEDATDEEAPETTLDDEIAEKPYPTEHAGRQEEPHNFHKFRRVNNAFGSGIHAIYGIDNHGKTHVQSVRFDATKFTPAEAEAWLKEHKMKGGIEPAKPHKKDMEPTEEPKEELVATNEIKPAGEPDKPLEVTPEGNVAVKEVEKETKETKSETKSETIAEEVLEIAKDVEAVAHAVEAIPSPATPIAIIVDKVAEVVEHIAEEIIENNKEETPVNPSTPAPVTKSYCTVIRKGGYKLTAKDIENIKKGKLVFK